MDKFEIIKKQIDVLNFLLSLDKEKPGGDEGLLKYANTYVLVYDEDDFIDQYQYLQLPEIYANKVIELLNPYKIECQLLKNENALPIGRYTIEYKGIEYWDKKHFKRHEIKKKKMPMKILQVKMKPEKIYYLIDDILGCAENGMTIEIMKLDDE